MAHLTVNPVADQKPINYGYELSNLLYEIRRERRIELVGEGFRMDDLKRWNAMKLLENPLTTLGIRVTDKVKEQYNEIYASIAATPVYITARPISASTQRAMTMLQVASVRQRSPLVVSIANRPVGIEQESDPEPRMDRITIYHNNEF